MPSGGSGIISPLYGLSIVVDFGGWGDGGVLHRLVEFGLQRVVTLSMVDQVHGRPEGTAKRNFSEHKSRLIEGEDFYLIDFSHKDELRTFGIEVPPRGLTVLAESGYLMLAKSFTDDLAWGVQRQLAKSYFRHQHVHALISRHIDGFGRRTSQILYYESFVVFAIQLHPIAASLGAAAL